MSLFLFSFMCLKTAYISYCVLWFLHVTTLLVYYSMAVKFGIIVIKMAIKMLCKFVGIKAFFLCRTYLQYTVSAKWGSRLK